jgi:hypothetical protein
MLDGYQPGDPVVRVFAYQASPRRPAEEIAEEAFAIFNDHPTDAAGAELACAYYGRRLRSLSFPGNRRVAAGRVAFAIGPCPRWSSRPPGEPTSCERRVSTGSPIRFRRQPARLGPNDPLPASEFPGRRSHPQSLYRHVTLKHPASVSRSSGEGTGQKSHRERCIRR